MKLHHKRLLLLAALVPLSLSAQTKKWDDYRSEHGISLPTWNIKTNLLSDVTGSLNLALEFRLGNHASLNVVGQHNPFKFRPVTEGDLTWSRTKWWHWAIQPELRFWLKETFRSHFFGLHGHYANYDVAGLPKPFSAWMHTHRFHGDLYGVGVSWGHRWNFSRHWGLEVTAGVGYVHLDHTRCTIEPCDDSPVREKKDYFAPTKLGVNLILGFDSRESAPVAEPVVVPVVVPVPEPAVEVAKVRYEPRFAPSFIIPEAEVVKVRDESGSAYLEFPVGNAVINPNFRNNAAELARIDEMVGRVKRDPDATITGITLIGNASPEGSYSSNMSLSQRRAEALRTYLNRSYGFSPDVITARGAGEDWDGLSTLVSESYIPGRETLLGIIDGYADYDLRDRMMMAADRAGYSTMVRDIYPRLRRTDYKLDFEVAPISIERGKEIMRTNPRNLSLNELFLIAQTYRPGSEEFREVNEIAARTFPDSDVANINAAAAAIQRDDLTSAVWFLNKVSDRSSAEWNNNMGIVAFMQGDTARAATFFGAAGTVSSTNAAELEKHLESVR